MTTFSCLIRTTGTFFFYHQAYFYENLLPCNDSYKPSFRGSLNDLLMKINSASRDDLLIPGNAPSTTSRYVHVEDSDTDPSCVDAKVCPLNYFRKHRIFVFTLPMEHPDLVDLENYRVTEILLNFAVSVMTSSHVNVFTITCPFWRKSIGHTHTKFMRASFVKSLSGLLNRQSSCANFGSFRLEIDSFEYLIAQIYCIFRIFLYHDVSVQGAQPISKNRFLKMTIESSGDLCSKFEGDMHTFLTRPLDLAFEYDVIDGT